MIRLQSTGFASVSKLLEPTLAAVQPLTNGLDTGITDGAGKLETGVNQAGKGIDSLTCGVGSIVKNAIKGVGNTLVGLPETISEILHNIDGTNNIITNILNVIL